MSNSELFNKIEKTAKEIAEQTRKRNTVIYINTSNFTDILKEIYSSDSTIFEDKEKFNNMIEENKKEYE